MRRPAIKKLRVLVRTLVFICIAVLFILSIVVVVCIRRDELNANQIESIINRDVAPHEKKAVVQLWLDARGWRYSVANDVRAAQWRGKTVAEHAGIKNDAVASFTCVVLEQEAPWWRPWQIGTTEVDVYFLFDKSNNLVKTLCVEDVIMP